MPRKPQDTDVRVMIPRRAEAAWRRVSATLAGKLAEVGAEPTNANIMAAALGLLDQVLHPDRGAPFGLSPGAPYEVPETTRREPHPPEQREKFWQNLEQNPPPPDFAPILPGPEYGEEAKTRFPHIYGRPETADDDS